MGWWLVHLLREETTKEAIIMPNPLDLERFREYCERNRDEIYLPAAVEEIGELRAAIVVAKAERLSLWCGLKTAHDMMVTWFSSEYADSPKANEIRKLIDAYRPINEQERKP